ncbi:MAG: formate/nitrite transporter family protein [Fusobacteriaceae bacterium]|nr:formate/nitrite transporter family protein [Fusobacteriaceae bacterium]
MPNKKLKDLIKGVYAGFLIGMGGIVYLSCDNKYIGSFLFSIGLFIICVYGLNLYTGKIGYFDIHKMRESSIFIIIVWMGNFIGTGFTGILVNLAGKTKIIDGSTAIILNKINMNGVNILASSFFCGILMYLAVNTFIKYRENNQMLGFCAVFMGVMVFILSGFDHSIANMFYISCAKAWNADTIKIILIATFGNGLGAMFIRQIGTL